MLQVTIRSAHKENTRTYWNIKTDHSDLGIISVLLRHTFLNILIISYLFLYGNSFTNWIIVLHFKEFVPYETIFGVSSQSLDNVWFEFFLKSWEARYVKNRLFWRKLEREWWMDAQQVASTGRNTKRRLRLCSLETIPQGWGPEGYRGPLLSVHLQVTEQDKMAGRENKLTCCSESYHSADNTRIIF